jgi:large subunit ribosomal protein L1
MGRQSKRYREALEKVDAGKQYSVREALELLKSLPRAKFDETVEVALKLGVDPRQSDQNVRGSVVLPKGTGRSVRVVVFAEGEPAEKAKAAGADLVGSEDLVKKIQGGWFEFDVAVAVPAMMRHVGKLGRVLGPKGLMPSPKAGTVTDKVGEAVKEFKAGRVEFRCDSGGNVHVSVGKISFATDDLVENIEAFLETVRRAKPSAVKGNYIQKAVLGLTMSPGVRLAGVA